VVTVELEPVGDNQTRFTWVEQVTFLVRTSDGSADVPHLRGAIALRFNGRSVAVSQRLVELPHIGHSRRWSARFGANGCRPRGRRWFPAGPV